LRRRAQAAAIGVLLVTLLAGLAALAAPAANANARMWLGFHDDPSYRWVPLRDDRIERSAEDGATIVRLLVQWNLVAPKRPSTPSNPFDPAYRFDDLDEAILGAQAQGQEAMLTISGTPRWAGARKPNRMPRNLRDLRLFAQAIAARYSGFYKGYPFVRFWSVWNEPNLNLFLAPQFDERGRSVAPANYAKLYAAAYTGIKAGNRLAQVAIGETSPRGKDSARGLVVSHSPGRFAELVAKANPHLKFDAWAHHPYPSTPNVKPGASVRWPNISLTSLPTLDKNLNRWFHRRSTPIWVTEYGHQTRPEDPLGVSYAKQATDIRQAIAIAREMPFVTMFIWFVYQDDQGQPWQSGLYTESGTPKGRSPTAFRSVAAALDARNPAYTFRRGTLTLTLRLFARRFCANDDTGTPIGMTWRLFRSGRLVKVDQESSPLLRDCTVAATIRFSRALAKGQSYVATLELNDANGIELDRRLLIRST
jgi:uncharacterized membrane protein